MKPRIRMIAGVWHCGLRGARGKQLGVGFTPLQAYRDWCGVRNG
ncbi:hypothetical protein [Acidovorax sp. Leaf160]|nr:hypothetical protein [Acidovorax sp. Leaf160]